MLNGLADVVGECSKCFLGASSMLGNGRLSARAGSAMVAMMAKSADLPVIVLCESIKFTGRVALDSIVVNEIGDADSLVDVEGEAKGLEGWRDLQNLQVLNLMYDVTPAEYLDMVITELGDLPPRAVPVVNGLHGGDDS